MTHYNVETWQSVGLYSTDQIIICNSSTLKLTDGQTNKNGAEMVGWLLICSHLSISDNQLWALSAEIWKKYECYDSQLSPSEMETIIRDFKGCIKANYHCHN